MGAKAIKLGRFMGQTSYILLGLKCRCVVVFPRFQRTRPGGRLVARMFSRSALTSWPGLSPVSIFSPPLLFAFVLIEQMRLLWGYKTLDRVSS